MPQLSRPRRKRRNFSDLNGDGVTKNQFLATEEDTARLSIPRRMQQNKQLSKLRTVFLLSNSSFSIIFCIVSVYGHESGTSTRAVVQIIENKR